MDCVKFSSGLPVKSQLRHHTHSLMFGAVINGAANGDRADLFSKMPAHVLDNHRRLTHPVENFPNRVQVTASQDPIIQEKLKTLIPFFSSRDDKSRFEKLCDQFVQWGDRSNLIEWLDKMIEAKQVNLKEFGKALLEQYFNDHGIVVPFIADDQLEHWNLNYLNELSVELMGRFRKPLTDMIQAALRGRFHDYLHDETTAVGRTNLATKRAFETMFSDCGVTLDYDAWLNYPGTTTYKKTSPEEVYTRIQSSFETMFPVPAVLKKQLLSKNFGPDFEPGQFISRDKTSLNANLIWALFDASCQSRSAERNLQETLPRLESTLDELLTRKSDEELEIRLWKRQPGQDLFQGNRTGSCIALGYGNGGTAVRAAQHTFIQVAEFYNKAKKDMTGKALFFWSKDLRTGEPVFIINTFEGRHDGCEEDPVSRDALLEFAKNYSAKVAGKPVRIYTADSPFNTLYRSDLRREVLDLQVVGNTTDGVYYFDTFGMKDTVLSQPQCQTPILLVWSPSSAPSLIQPPFFLRASTISKWVKVLTT